MSDPQRPRGDPYSLDIKVREGTLEGIRQRIRSSRTDVRPAIPEFTMDADEFQRRVIRSDEDTIRMVAPAGSGKTQTIVNRVLRRVRDGIGPSRILLLTFDNSAVASIRQKLEEQAEAVPEAAAAIADLNVSTLNAFGYRILRESFRHEYKRVATKGAPSYIVSGILRDLEKAWPEKYALLPPYLRYAVYLDLFSFLKNELCDPRDIEADHAVEVLIGSRQAQPFTELAGDDDTLGEVFGTLLGMFRQYEEGLQKGNQLDFDDQKLRSYVCLREAPQTLKAIQGRFDEVVVDEFQDINLLDFTLIKAISERAALVVTGDDDQAIYGFRGSSPKFIIGLGDHIDREITPFELSMNYRCPPNIVDHADRLIRHNVDRIPKNPIAKRTDPSDIVVVSTVSAGLEAKAIFDYVERVKAHPPHPEYGDFAVLYRTNAQSLPLQVELLLRGIPYQVREEDNILTNDLLLRLLGILRCRAALLAQRSPDPSDEVLVIEAYFRRVRKAQIDALRRALLAPHDFMAFLESTELAEVLPQAGRSKIAEAVRELLYAKNLMAVISIVADRFHGMRGMVGSLEDAILDRVPLGEVTELAAEFGDDADAFVEQMERALEAARRSDAGHSDDGVPLLTYFKAKGRQWQTVILTTCNEGLIPHWRGDLEEERRLFYVALTRASSNLLISYVAHAVGQGVRPSRFLFEAGLLVPSTDVDPDEEAEEDDEDELEDLAPEEPVYRPPPKPEYRPQPPVARARGQTAPRSAPRPPRKASPRARPAAEVPAKPPATSAARPAAVDGSIVYPADALRILPDGYRWERGSDGQVELVLHDGQDGWAALLLARTEDGWTHLTEFPSSERDPERLVRARAQLFRRLVADAERPSGHQNAFFLTTMSARDKLLRKSGESGT